ncbi:glycosyltransferase family 4 protein [Marinomonas dokdonensis]|uniref:glycosyltransferase family 4 protein n=1 Tax=Marinomonas dokdonensis TaxID=328224 RepID=UPI0040554A01
MNIAIDARPLSVSLTGIGRYLDCLLKSLLKLDTVNTYYLFSDRELVIDYAEFNNVVVVVGGSKGRLSGTLFAQVFFPCWAIKYSIDLFWSPRHHLPLLFILNKKLKKFVTVHDVVWIRCPETMSKLGLLLEQLLFKPSLQLAHKVFVLSKFTESELLTCTDVAPEKVVNSGYGAITFNLNPKKHYGESDPYLLFVGTIEPRKNIGNILEAFSLFRVRNKNMKLIIVGKEGWNIDLNKLLVKNSLGKNDVIVKGFVEDDELNMLYLGCELLLMPSLYEGFGFPALEALMLGKKVVVSEKCAIAEMSHYNANVTVTNTDSHSLLESINEALSKPFDSRKNISPASWDDVARKFLNQIK